LNENSLKHSFELTHGSEFVLSVNKKTRINDVVGFNEKQEMIDFHFSIVEKTTLLRKN
jgi:hypothetical protein